MRSGAVVLVFLFHVNQLPQLGALYTYIYKIAIVGNVGVSFFFMLSGFVLAWLWTPNASTRNFFARRFSRIYPTYILTLLAGYCLSTYDGGPRGLRSSLASAMLVQAWVPRFGTYFADNNVAWSLSVESFFYLSFPMLAAMLYRTSAHARRLIMITAVLATTAIGVGAHLYAAHKSVLMSGGVPAEFWFVTIFPITRLPEFLLGICVALEVRRSNWLHKIPWIVAAAPAAISFVICSHLYRAAPPYYSQVCVAAITVAPFALLIGVTAARESFNRRAGILALRPFIWLGERSYVFYLTHAFFIRAFSKFFLGHALYSLQACIAWTFALFAAAVLTAHLGYRYVEVPAERAIRARLVSRSSQPSTAVLADSQ